MQAFEQLFLKKKFFLFFSKIVEKKFGRFNFL